MERSTVVRALVTGAVLAGLAVPAAGFAAAAPTAPTAPAVTTGCDPSRLQGEIAPGDSETGHRHYRVTLFSGPDAAPCVIAGSPVDASFDRGGAPVDVKAGAYGDQTGVVRLSQSPVHFDVRVPNTGDGAQADGITFTLRSPDGTAAADPSRVAGSLRVVPGTVLGPVEQGV